MKSGVSLRCARSRPIYAYPVATVAHQVILGPGIGQFREFESPRVHTRIKFVGTCSRAQIDLRKARERELATLDEKSTMKIKGKNRGGEGTTPVTTACPEAGK